MAEAAWTAASLGAKTVPQLRELLQDRRVKHTGKKAELIDRLLGYASKARGESGARGVFKLEDREALSAKERLESSSNGTSRPNHPLWSRISDRGRYFSLFFFVSFVGGFGGRALGVGGRNT